MHATLNLSPCGLVHKKQETRNETERKRDPCFFRTFSLPHSNCFRQVQFPATKRREKEEKKNLQVDDQDGVRSSLAGKSAGLSLHNNIIIGINQLSRINEQTKTKTNCGHTHIISTYPSRPCLAASPTLPYPTLPRVVSSRRRQKDMSVGMQGAGRN